MQIPHPGKATTYWYNRISGLPLGIPIAPRNKPREVSMRVEITPEAREWLAARGNQLTIMPPARSGG